MEEGAVKSNAQLGTANWKNSLGLKLFESEVGAPLFMTLLFVCLFRRTLFIASARGLVSSAGRMKSLASNNHGTNWK